MTYEAADPAGCPRRDAGFTLIELILTIIIAVVALFPLLAMFSNATHQSVQPILYTQAGFLAQQRAEEILADYASPSRGYDYVVNANYPALLNPPEFPGFTVTVSVAPEAISNGVTYKEVVVTAAQPAINDVTLTMWVSQ